MSSPRLTRAFGCAAVAALLCACGDNGTTPQTSPTPPIGTPTPRPSIDALLAVCPTAGQIQAINSRLQLVFDADPSRGQPLACTAAQGSADLTYFQKRVYLSFVAMQQIPFDAPLPWTSLPLYDWLVATIHGVHFVSGEGYSWCCEPGGRIVIATAANQATDNSCLTVGHSDRWIFPVYGGSSGCGMDAFIALVVHEARHNNGKLHTCQSTKDNTIAEMGSWGVEYYLYRWFAEHTGDYLSPGDGQPSSSFYRHIARSSAFYICRDRFCHDKCPPDIAPTQISGAIVEDHMEWHACAW
jgi:hypothetical protein